MSATTRGAAIFAGLVLALIVCAWVSFSILPNMGASVALPVISVPGEAYNGVPSSQDLNLTNTVVSVLLADIAVIIFMALAWTTSNGWTKEVPGRFQSWVEMLGDFIYGQTKSFAGNKPLARNFLFPLAASIFVFLLAVNWMKLLPGVESVGILHCAHEGISGYPTVAINDGSAYRLWVNGPLNPGQRANEADYENCEHWLHTGGAKPSQDSMNAAADRLFDEEGTLKASLEAADATDEEIDAAVNQLRLEATEGIWAHPTFGLTANDLREGVIPYVQVVTPYVRAASTDLNLTIGLALVAVIAVQVFGVLAQGPAYFQKFINLGALGNIQKKPLGAIDFIVGLIEIISEIGKIISLAFRLFGNMFAGSILLAVMTFLAAFLLPVVFYGLEVIVTSIQAYVFAILTIVFSAQAMEGHHGDDEHGDDHEGHAEAHA
jgi:F-type H+-transporting ATPase subunit a